MTGPRSLINATAPNPTRRDDDDPTPPCTDVTSWDYSDWIWYDHSAHEEAEALAIARGICAPCPLRATCLAGAIERKEPGIWAGTTEAQRRALTRGTSGVASGVRCTNQHDLTLPDATSRNGQCKECRNARERRARARNAGQVAS